MTETIGQRLKKARKHRNLTLDKVAETTHIRQVFLHALEADDHAAIPSAVQARGFLRNYAQYLDLDLDQIIEELRTSQPDQKPGTVPEVLFEGDRAAATPTREEVQPIVETDGDSAEAPAEPFWQSWLRRAKSDESTFGKQEITASGLQPSSSASTNANLSETDQSPSPGVQDSQNEATSEQAAVSKPDSAPDAAQTVDTSTVEIGSEPESLPNPGSLFIERIKSLIPRMWSKPALAVEIVADPEPEPESGIESPAEEVISSQEIINEIGMQLRQRREMLSLTLEEIERHTRLRTEIMVLLEQGNFDELPSPVQTRGMLANYAGFLDLEVDTLLLRFADALQARHRERQPVKPARRRGQPIIPENMPFFRTFIAGDIIFGVGMVLLLVGFSVWGISRVIALQSDQGTEIQVEATSLSISEALIGTPVETVVSEVTLIPAQDTPIPALAEGEATIEIPTLAANANVQINVVALERSFLRVIIDGEVAFEGRTIPGNAYPFEAEQSIEILAGNGSALRIIYNQRDMGLLGGFGQIVNFIYTANDILVPTPAVSPTATSTPFISPTPSLTPSPTITPSPTTTPTRLPADG